MKFNSRSSQFTQIISLCFAVSVHLICCSVVILKRAVDSMKTRTRPERIRRP